MAEVKAVCEVKGNTAYLFSDPVGTPILDRSADECAVYDNFLFGGAYCYQVCGDLPHGRRPERIEYFIRHSHQEDKDTWSGCSSEDGCQTYAESFDDKSGKVCAYFKLWKGGGEHRDLLMKVDLS
jgi:hypothetical protein